MPHPLDRRKGCNTHTSRRSPIPLHLSSCNKREVVSQSTCSQCSLRRKGILLFQVPHQKVPREAGVALVNVQGRISNSLAGFYIHKNLHHHLSQASLLNQKSNKLAGVFLVNVQAMLWVESLIILQVFTFTKSSTIIPPRHHC